MAKPIKGPVILPPLEPQSIWRAPNTPVTAAPQQFQASPQPNANTFNGYPASQTQNTTGSGTTGNVPQGSGTTRNVPQGSSTTGNLPTGSGTRSGAIAPVGTIQSVSPAAASPLTAPKSIIREQQPVPPKSFQFQPSAPVQTSPANAIPVQPNQNSFQQGQRRTFQNPQSSIQSPQSSENDFVPGGLSKKVKQAAVVKSEPETINRASTIASDFAPSKFASDFDSPGQELVKQVGFVEPATNPVAQDEPVVTFQPGKVVAIVGGEPIFVGDMLYEINQLVERFIAKAPEEVKARERQKLIPQILPKFVESKLLYHGMLSQLPEGVDIEAVLESTSSEFDKKARPKLMEAAGVETLPEFDAYLRRLGSSLRNLRQSWGRDQMTRYFLAQKLTVNNEVTHQEMLQNYRENLDSYAHIAKSRWEQIMIRFDRSASREAALAEIRKLNNQIVHGANLAALAKKSSHGFLASDGGQHDWTSKGALVLKEIDEAIFALPTGVLSKVIETKDGFHIIRVVERTEAGHTSFLDAQVDIKRKIISKKRKAAYDKHLAELRAQIPVEYMINNDAIAKLNAQQGSGRKHR